ncbi:Glycosyl transferase family 2 [Limimonas halophila]|uniref:Glycosyl transferase family 2 n=1 Tax=Limimonas halophila TaxID=1082479 RepID=A0A1G7UCA2_9PROT|nr:glycosyltransferase family A protein [Limimonas halophila]SDG45103.1 Glycosyl transferase family 2 [Limimonas halophila]
MPPTVSVVMPAYNRAHTVGAAVDSVLAQSFADFELIVIDDGSTDATAAVVRQRGDARVHLVSHEHNRGLVASRNHALALSEGRYVAVLDSDDLAAPDRLARQVHALDTHPDLGEVGGWIRRIDERGRPGRIKRHPTSPRAVRAQMPWRAGIAHTTAMLRGDLARRLAYDLAYAQAEDSDLHARVLASHEIANIGAVLGFKRSHGGQTSADRTAARAGKQAVMARFLRQLGIEADAGELDRHFELTRPAERTRPLNGAELAWAAAWLDRLRAANARHAAFPEPEFSAFATLIQRHTALRALPRTPGHALTALWGMRRAPSAL